MTLFDGMRSACQLAGRAMVRAMDLILGEEAWPAPEVRPIGIHRGWSPAYREWRHKVARERYQDSEAADGDTRDDITPYKGDIPYLRTSCPACGAHLKARMHVEPVGPDPKPDDFIKEDDRFVVANPRGVWRWVGNDAVYVPPGPPSCWGRLSRDKDVPATKPTGGWRWVEEDVAGLFDRERAKHDAVWDRMGTVHDKGHAPSSAAEAGQ